jgi:hypothetical protein
MGPLIPRFTTVSLVLSTLSPHLAATMAGKSTAHNKSHDLLSCISILYMRARSSEYVYVLVLCSRAQLKTRGFHLNTPGLRRRSVLNTSLWHARSFDVAPPQLSASHVTSHKSRAPPPALPNEVLSSEPIPYTPSRANIISRYRPGPSRSG